MSKTCPDYRLRLFLSIDLSGSTEYKVKNNLRKDNLYPKWVHTITKGFYDTFPSIFENECSELKCEAFPKIWKKIGDEIIFCNRILSDDHFGNCVLAFKKLSQNIVMF